MKNYKTLLAAASLLLCGGFMTACSDGDKVPGQPDFIVVSLTGTLTVDSGDSFTMSVPTVYNADSYIWTVPSSMLSIAEGQGTNSITVDVTAEKGVIPEGSIYVVARNNKGEGYRRTFYQDITILEPAPTLENYATKRYGTKTWMVEELKETGENDDLGTWYNGDPELGKIYGRLYTWHEAITGIPNCTAEQNPYFLGYEGTDDAGNDFIFSASLASYNIQIQGVCPDGWHIPNVYDYWDLLNAIKTEYNIPASSMADVGSSFQGYIVGFDRESESNVAAYTLTNWGYIGGYLKGSGPDVDGGLWLTSKSGIYNNGTTFYYGGAASGFTESYDYPLYMSERSLIGFNLLPGGKRTGSSGNYTELGDYSFNWVAYMYTSGSNTVALRRTVSSANVNWSVGGEALANSCYVRCVANY